MHSQAPLVRMTTGITSLGGNLTIQTKNLYKFNLWLLLISFNSISFNLPYGKYQRSHRFMYKNGHWRIIHNSSKKIYMMKYYIIVTTWKNIHKILDTVKKSKVWNAHYESNFCFKISYVNIYHKCILDKIGS